MMQNSIKDRIDLELKHIELKDELKNNIRNATVYRKSNPVWRSIAAYRDYDEIKDALGVKLLDTELSNDNPYMLCRLDTDAKDYAIITVDNFILGDTSNYNLVESGKRYSYEHGLEYISPVSLKVVLILSESQMNIGWNVDYLGLYEFVESYTSSQGYKVNILQTTVMEEGLKDFVSTKVAVFVADGVQYTLKGQISLDTLKNIINTMEYSSSAD